ETGRVDRARRRHVADRSVDTPAAATDSLDHPLEHAAVVAVAGPEELAVGALAEPVHPEQLRELRALAATDRQPVGEVVAHVVTAERQHRERVEAQLADDAR